MINSGLIKAIQDIMRQDDGVDGDAQRLSQLVWMIFLKVLDDNEQELELLNKDYVPAVPKEFQWRTWAADEEGLTGASLLELVNNKLFPTLKELPLSTTNQRNQIVRGVFEDSHNYMKNGTLLRQVVNKINTIDFNKQGDRHSFNDIYETLLRSLQSAGNSGEYYTPRPVTQFITEMVDPKFGETVLDPACGTGGFLSNAIEHIRKQVKTPEDERVLQDSIRGVEKKQLPHLLCTTNMILHGIEVPVHIRRDNTLKRPLKDYGPADRVDVILTNPPFGGTEEPGIESNFPQSFRTRETADLFLVLIMKLLNTGGRAGLVLPDGTLFGEGVKARIKEELLRECNLHTVVRLPKTVFAPYTDIATNLLFFNKGEPTSQIWYYELTLPQKVKSYNKTNPIKLEEFDSVRKWWTNREENEYAWKVDVSEVIANNYNLDIPNPNRVVDAEVTLESHLERHRNKKKEIKGILDEFLPELNKLQGQTHSRDLKFIAENIYEILEIEDATKLIEKVVLKNAVQGKLVPQLDPEGTARDLINRIDDAKQKLILSGRMKKDKVLPPIQSSELIFNVPSNWEWVRTQNIAEYIQRGKGPKYVDRSSVPVVSQKCIQWAGFDIKKARFIDESTLNKYGAERFLRDGDLLINSTGTGTIGRINTYVEDPEYDKVVVDSHVTVLRLILANPEYFRIWWSSDYVQRGIESSDASGTTNQIELNLSTVVSKALPLPPLKEQERIVEAVKQIFGTTRKIREVLNS